MRPGGLAHAHRVVAAEPAAALPVLARAQALQLRVHPGQRLESRGSPKACCASSISSLRWASLIELSIRCAAAARLASRSTSSSVFCGFSGKNSPCLAMNWSNCAVVSWPAAWLASRSLRSSSISRIRSTSSGGRVLHRLLHALEPLVEHLAAEQVADLLVGLARVGGPPVVLGELPHGPAGVGGQGVELHLAEPGVVAVVAGERVALGLDRLAEQLADLLQGAVEPVVALQARPALARPPASGRRARAARRCRAAAAPAAPCAARSPP